MNLLALVTFRFGSALDGYGLYGKPFTENVGMNTAEVMILCSSISGLFLGTMWLQARLGYKTF
jgi:hypothetical protein